MKSIIAAFFLFLVIVTSSCTKTQEPIIYPLEGRNGLNILNEIDSVYQQGRFSAAAIIPEGQMLTLKMQGLTADELAVGEGFGWVRIIDENNLLRSYYETWKDGEVDLTVFFNGNITLEIYENGALEPTRTKRLYLKIN